MSVVRRRVIHLFLIWYLFPLSYYYFKCDVKYIRFILKKKSPWQWTYFKGTIRTLYIHSKVILITFKKCNVDVKKELFRSYCTSFYFGLLWTSYNTTLLSKLRVTYNNIYRKSFILLPRCSSSLMSAMRTMFQTHSQKNIFLQ